MRIDNWKVNEVLAGAKKAAIDAANKSADTVVARAKSNCPVGALAREGGKDWQNRKPGTLKNSIRKVVLDDKPENIRVYAGSKKAYYAYMVEYGTVHMSARRFLRPAFHGVKASVIPGIEAGMRRALEVKK